MTNWDLIDWALVGWSALWLLGLSVILAALSFADYRASAEYRRLRQVLGLPGYQRALNGGAALVALGALGGSGNWWEAAIWAILSLGFIYLAWQAR